MAFLKSSKEGEEEEEEEEEERESSTSKTATLDVNSLLALPNLSEEQKRALLQLIESKQPKVIKERVIISSEEYDKQNEMKDKIKDIELKQIQINNYIDNLKNKEELCKKNINEEIDNIIMVINERRKELIDQVTKIISQKIEQGQIHIQQLKQCYQDFIAYGKKVEEKWNDNSLNLKERKEEIIKESNIRIQKYIRIINEYNMPNDNCFFNFQSKNIIQNLKTFGNVSDIKFRVIDLNLISKHITSKSVTVSWKDKNKKIKQEDNLENEYEFVIQYKRINNEKEEKKEEKIYEKTEEEWGGVKLKRNKNEQTWEHTIENLQSYTTYAFRIKLQPPSSIPDSYSTFSDIITCQTEKLNELLSFSMDRIWNGNNVVLENNNTLVRLNVDRVQVSMSLPKCYAVNEGIHCWRFYMSNQVSNNLQVILGVANANKTFTNMAFQGTEVWGYYASGAEWNDSQGTYVRSLLLKWDNEKEIMVDMYMNIDKEKKELKWKEVKKDGQGNEYKLQDTTTFNKYHNLSFVPHIYFQTYKGTSVEVRKISPTMYGIL